MHAFLNKAANTAKANSWYKLCNVKNLTVRNHKIPVNIYSG